MSELEIATTSRVSNEDLLRPMKVGEIKDFDYDKRYSIRPVMKKKFPKREWRSKGKVKNGVKVLEVIRLK